MVNTLKDITVSSGTSIHDVLALIDNAASRFAFVNNSHDELIGTVTDGDIRRGLLQGLTLSDSIDRCMNRDFKSISTVDKKSKAYCLARRFNLNHIPVLSEEKKVVELISVNLHNIKDALENPVVIMAGGKGMRLRPYTETCPKPMLKVGNTPMLEILIERCIDSGFRNFYISVNYLKRQIIDYFEDGSKWGVDIKYLDESEPLGTAGSLKLLPSTIMSPFIVINGDVLTRLDLANLLEFHTKNRHFATMGVREYENMIPFGVAVTQGDQLIDFQEKPRQLYLVNAGVYVIDPRALDLIKVCEHIDMPSLLKRAKDAGHKVAVHQIHDFWMDVGHPEALIKAESEWS